MKPSLAMTVLVSAAWLAVPATAFGAQARGRSHTPSGNSGGHASGGGSAQSGGGTAVPRGERSGSGGAPSADKGASGDHAVADGDSADRGPESSGAIPPHSRPRDGRTAVGQAVPRSSAPPVSGGGIVVTGGYPWGFSGLGLGGYYDPYSGYYDPYGGYQRYPRSSYTFGYEGALRLKVKPRAASVWVDGYYVGLVDDFDGVFQRLHLETGPHRIDISAPGYEPLTFDVGLEPNQTLTYRGELRKIP